MLRLFLLDFLFHAPVALLRGPLPEDGPQQGHMAGVQQGRAPAGGGEGVPAELQQPQQEQFVRGAEGRAPGEVGQAVVVPDVELVVQGSAHRHANQIATEERQQ